MRISMKHKIKIHLAACALAGAAFSGSALGAIVCGTAPIPIPNDINGAYINLVTGVTGPSAGGVVGWDVNMYNTASALYFFWPSSPANSFGGVATGTVYDALTAGAPIGASQTYILNSGAGGPAPYVNWQVASTGNYLGVRFHNEATAAINYGWLQLDTGAAGGFPAIINQYCYENAGATIVAGDTGAPPPAATLGFTVASLPFGNVNVGSTSAAQTVTLSNTGTASGSVTALAIDTGVFAITGGTCGATPITLAAGANCTLTMTFSPAATGPAAGTLSFTASAGAGIGPNATVALSGTGMAPPPAPITTVPVNSPWALAALLAMFGLLAGVTLRRR